MWITLLLAGAIAVQAQPEITVKPVPGKGHVATVTPFPEADIDAVYARLKLVASGQCGKLKVRFGRFKYNTIVDNGVRKHINYEQGFSCIDPATDPYKPVPGDWKASSKDDADARAFVDQYLAVVDAADAVRGLKMMEPILEIDRATWSEQPNALKALRGTGSRTILGPVWQNNPENASHPGAYANFLFKGSYSGLAAHCGFLSLYRAGPGKYQVSQQSMVIYPKQMVESGAISAAEATRACKDY